jgi:multicomponent Na+:H+ antiporter subunit A
VKGVRHLVPLLAAVTVLVNLVLSVALLGREMPSLYVSDWGPARTLGIQLVCDGLSVFMALTISLLFLSSGAFEQQVGTRGLKAMGGLVRRMPVTAFCCRVGALSIAGVPPFNAYSHRLRSFLWTVEP